jgi:hypothetical protein
MFAGRRKAAAPVSKPFRQAMVDRSYRSSQPPPIGSAQRIGDHMPQERLSKIWDMLFMGSRVLGWRHQDEGERQVLTSVNGRSSWERTAPDSRWQEVTAS